MLIKDPLVWGWGL